MSHPTGFNSEPGRKLTLKYAEALKKSGASVLAELIGGYQNLEINDKIIAESKSDLIGMARAFICDPDYYKKALEGRGEDVVPCVQCNKYHVPVPGLKGPWLSRL